MPAQNALAIASLASDPIAGGFHVTLQVWNRSYDHPDPARRNALITKVKLTRLAGNQNSVVKAHIVDRYGIDETRLWMTSSGLDAGFEGYTEVGPVTMGSTTIGVIWGSYVGVYDERCLADPNCDRMRLQTNRPDQHRITVYNYLIGPVTFSFDIKQPTPPKAVRLTMGHIGGNDGNPGQRDSTLPDEEFTIEFP
jgi:hypothetical protein